MIAAFYISYILHTIAVLSHELCFLGFSDSIRSAKKKERKKERRDKITQSARMRRTENALPDDTNTRDEQAYTGSLSVTVAIAHR